MLILHGIEITSDPGFAPLGRPFVEPSTRARHQSNLASRGDRGAPRAVFEP